MQRGRGGRDDFFGFGGFPLGFGGLGGRPGSLISSFFGGNDPFDDPFFTRPFESMMGSSIFGPGGGIFGDSGHATHGRFLEHESFPPQRSEGPIIKELNADDEEEESSDRENNVNPRKHLRSDKEPYVEEPDDDMEGRKNKHVQIINEFNRANAKRQQNGSYLFQSSTVSYGGPGGTYYTSSRTKRAGGDGVIMEEMKEADSTTGKATHMISKGIHEKGHSVTRKLNSDGKVDTLQTLHNLDEDELPSFEETWHGKAKQYLPEWSPALENRRIGGNDRREVRPSGRMALPSIPQPQLQHQQSTWANANVRNEGQPSSRMVAPPGQPQLQASGRTKSQTGLNPYDRRFN